MSVKARFTINQLGPGGVVQLVPVDGDEGPAGHIALVAQGDDLAWLEEQAGRVVAITIDAETTDDEEPAPADETPEEAAAAAEAKAAADAEAAAKTKTTTAGKTAGATK